jgi:acetyl-CoA acetyltransferase family protein
MNRPSRSIVILSACRTAFGTMNGTLKAQSATDLGVHASSAAIAAASIDPKAIDQVVFGNVQQTSADAIYLARHVGLRAGLRIEAPALTVNRLCGSGFEAVVQAAQQILLGEAECVLAGGSESMSQTPHVVRGLREGLGYGKSPQLEDLLSVALTDSFCKLPMAITAENLAERYGVTRADCDAYALESQRRWAAAQARGGFDDEIAPLEIVTKKGTLRFAVDEHPRPQSTLEGLAKLNPVFKKDGTVTAGNASGICDGAASLLVAAEDFAKAHGLRPLARLVGWGTAGVDPTVMGIGPAPAIRKTLDRAGISLEDVDRVEVNEAFAPQVLAVAKELGVDHARFNANGGAIALGHPLAASGARITAHLAHAIRRGESKIALGSACIGGGQGIAVLLEAV